MKSEEVVFIGAVGAGTGAVIHGKFGISTGNAVLDVGIGVAIAAIGWYMDYDGFGDFVEGFGVGYALDAAL